MQGGGHSRGCLRAVGRFTSSSERSTRFGDRKRLRSRGKEFRWGHSAGRSSVRQAAALGDGRSRSATKARNRRSASAGSVASSRATGVHAGGDRGRGPANLRTTRAGRDAPPAARVCLRRYTWYEDAKRQMCVAHARSTNRRLQARRLARPTDDEICWRLPGVARRVLATASFDQLHARLTDQIRRGRSLGDVGSEPAGIGDRPPTHPVELRARRGRCRSGPSATCWLPAERVARVVPVRGRPVRQSRTGGV